jgi:hypothetical protein
MKKSKSEILIENLVREVLNTKKQKRFRHGDVLFERSEMRKFGLITPIYLSEKYIVAILGIKKKNLIESKNDLVFRDNLLREHLLFEGWWDSAKQAVGDSIENIKKKIDSGADALKVYGENSKGVIAALWAASKDSSALETLQSGAQSLASKSVSAINKAIFKIESKLKELKLDSVAKSFESARNILSKFYDQSVSVSGWKGTLVAITSKLGFSWLRNKIGPVLQVFYDAISGDIKDFAKSIASGASSIAQDYKDVFDVGTGDPTEMIKKIAIDKLSSMIPDVIKSTVGQLGASAIESLAGPLGWIKKVIELFKGSAWVFEQITDVITRGNFKVGKKES